MDNLFSKSLIEIETIVESMGQPKFRAKQVREWLDKGCPEFSYMKNIPQDLQENLAKLFQTLPVKDESQLTSKDGSTTKFLFELNDGEKIEAVLMRTTYGNSVCVSSQVGCAMGCKFCASTLLGIKRNLEANEMFAQILRANWELHQGLETKPNGDKNQGDVTNIIIMGIGEPLQNRENVIGFMERAHNDMGIGWRKITLSTCGVVPEIIKLKEWGKPINLALSLHAPTDEMRKKIMPIANKYKIDETLEASFAYGEDHKRQLMIEYILLGGFNDGEEQANELVKLLKGKLCMVNLIPWNPVEERDWHKPSNNQAHRFQDILKAAGINTRIRRERGADINSACGQLRMAHADKKPAVI